MCHLITKEYLVLFSLISVFFRSLHLHVESDNVIFALNVDILVPLDNYISRSTAHFLSCKDPDYQQSLWEVLSKVREVVLFSSLLKWSKHMPIIF